MKQARESKACKELAPFHRELGSLTRREPSRGRALRSTVGRARSRGNHQLLPEFERDLLHLLSALKEMLDCSVDSLSSFGQWLSRSRHHVNVGRIVVDQCLHAECNERQRLSCDGRTSRVHVQHEQRYVSICQRVRTIVPRR